MKESSYIIIRAEVDNVKVITKKTNNEEALEAEYIRIQDHGGPKSRYNDADKYNYNEIQSPGEYFYKKNHGGSEYPRKIPIETE